MKVFSTSLGRQDLVIIPRSAMSDVIIYIKDENSDNSTTQAITATNSNGYMTISFIWDGFIEGHSYFIEVSNQNTIEGVNPLLWRGKGYCTDQTDLQNFKLIDEVRETPTII